MPTLSPKELGVKIKINANQNLPLPASFSLGIGLPTNTLIHFLPIRVKAKIRKTVGTATEDRNVILEANNPAIREYWANSQSGWTQARYSEVLFDNNGSERTPEPMQQGMLCSYTADYNIDDIVPLRRNEEVMSLQIDVYLFE